MWYLYIFFQYLSIQICYLKGLRAFLSKVKDDFSFRLIFFKINFKIFNSNEPETIRSKFDKKFGSWPIEMVGNDVALVRDLDDVDDEGVASILDRFNQISENNERKDNQYLFTIIFLLGWGHTLQS